MDLPGKLTAELTIASPGQETGVTNMLFSKTSLHDNKKTLQLRLCGY